VKNIIATISALASRIQRDDMNARQFVEALQGRLRGMAATHGLLSRANWQGAQLGDLIDTALRPLLPSDGHTIGVHGPALLMSPAGAATLGMVFYELATNAVKYGALAGPGGHLDVTWQIIGSAQANRVLLTWAETGGKPVPDSISSGFGMTFIKRSVEYELQGRAEMESASGGIRWTLEFPVPKDVHST
jgi:two-component system, chemotaxis family, CheB/CheR fusion protein